MIFNKKHVPVFRGLAATTFSLAVLATMGYGIADTWRSTVDAALGTTSYEISANSEPRYKSDYTKADDLMKELKEISVQEGIDGTAILKNDKNALPLASKAKINLWGSGSYNLYRGMNQAKNSDAVDLVGALKAAGFTLDPTLEAIYTEINEEQVVESSGWGGPRIDPKYPNQSAPAYDVYSIREVNPSKFTQEGFGTAASGWASSLTGDVNIVTFTRPGGEGNTYKPGATTDSDGNPLDQNPLAFSPDELAVIDAAKATGKPVIVLLNTSCQFELGPIVKGGEHEVDAIAYIGLPNDYQCTGIVKVLAGEENATGALADTYATYSTSSPSMMNFGGDMYSDYETVATTAGQDPRWNIDIANEGAGSFGGSVTYNGGMYYVEAEGIYTGYNYYETRYYDSIANPGYNAASDAGLYASTGTWNYDDEVCYTFGYGQSYLDYTEELRSIDVQLDPAGYITAVVRVTNTSDKAGRFRTELYVNAPYTEYDRENLVEKSAIQFLNSAKTKVIQPGAFEDVTIRVPSKYLASYDANGYGTYILDGGEYVFALGNGAHEAVNNVLAHQGHDVEGEESEVKTWSGIRSGTVDYTTFSRTASGGQVTNKLEKTDINYYLSDEDQITYLSRQDWKGTYPVDFNKINDGKGFTLADSPKKDEWIKELRNEQYTVKTDEPVENMDGVDNGWTWENMPGDAINDINHPFWDEYVEQIPAEEALGAIAHGGSQADELTGAENPIVKQYDGPAGFNNQTLSTNNGDPETDPYYVDPESEAGKFKDNIHSQTLSGSSFNPALAYRWGRALGNFGLWASVYNVWAAGLNVHRNPYNGRNIEYLSEDAMLTNIWGSEFIRATREMGILVGPKHLGFNDQEYNRAGVSAYMTEQKARQTDLRAFEGSIAEGGALGYMCAFNRMGATNVSHYAELHRDLIRGEWGFKGLITTDMMNNAYYFNPESCAMATITMMADFAGNNSHLNMGADGKDATWTYLSPEAIENDQTLVDASRDAMKYQLYAFANTAIKNISTVRVTPFWETALIALIAVTFTLAAASTVALALSYVLDKKEQN